LTHRLGELGHTILKGKVTLGIKPKDSNYLQTFILDWRYKPEKISNGFELTEKNAKKDLKANYFDKQMVTPLYNVLKKRKDDQNYDIDHFLGARESFIPRLGEVIWKTEDNELIDAYLYQTPYGEEKIGYLRIADYDRTSDKFEQLVKIIDYLQANSSALVIDQVDNPGGSVAYLLNILSLLSDKPLKLPTERMMITQDEVEMALSMIDMLEILTDNPDFFDVVKKMDIELPITLEQLPFFTSYYHFIISEWNAGRHFTNPGYMLGFDKVLPAVGKTCYTKPILLLTNSLDFSGGDFLPAVLQDNHRVTILGSRTAGAGGAVLNTSFPNIFGISNFSYTASIAVRENNNPIENIGVTPDIEYQLTEEDYQNNFKGYVEAINNAVFSLICLPCR
jgi:hypothetical protein